MAKETIKKEASQVNEQRQSIVINVRDSVLVQSTLETLRVFSGEIDRLTNLYEDSKASCEELKTKLNFAEDLKKESDSKIELLEAAKKDSDAKLEVLEAAKKDSDAKLEVLEAAKKDSDAKLELLEAAKKDSDAKLEVLEAAKKDSDAKLEVLEAAKKDSDSRLEIVANEKKDVVEKLGLFQESMYEMIQNALSEIGDLLPSLDDDSMLHLYVEDIRNKGNNSTNKGLSNYRDYKTIEEIARSLNLTDSVLSLLANLVWWSEQDLTRNEMKRIIRNIDYIAKIFCSRVLVPLELFGYKVLLPNFGFVKKESMINYKNIGKEDSYFKEMFSVKMDDYVCCRISTLAFTDKDGKIKEGSCYEYYS